MNIPEKFCLINAMNVPLRNRDISYILKTFTDEFCARLPAVPPKASFPLKQFILNDNRYYIVEKCYEKIARVILVILLFTDSLPTLLSEKINYVSFSELKNKSGRAGIRAAA